jgi:NADPH:quinone reductase-like Zn-dependent oxidoreductase
MEAITHSEYGSPDVLGLTEQPIPLAGLTAYQVLNRLGLASGETVLIHGGADGVGSLGIQIAVALGADVIATASEKNHDFLRSLGAHPIAYGEGLADRVDERKMRGGGYFLIAPNPVIRASSPRWNAVSAGRPRSCPAGASRRDAELRTAAVK